MNSKHTPKFKALLALFLSISMLFSMVVTSFAALDLSEIDVSIEDVNDDDTIHYIAFGDSVTNGFGLAGYTYPIPNSEDKNSPNGFQVDTITAYPYLIKEALADYYGDEYTVTYEPLAISGMRLGDLRAILTTCYDTAEEGRYDGDYYRSRNDFGWRGDLDEWLEREYYLEKADSSYEGKFSKYKDSGYFYIEYEGNEQIRVQVDDSKKMDLLYEEYSSEIKKADVLSIDLGTNDFGTFFTQRLQMLVGMDSKYPVGSIFVPGAIPEIDFSVFIDKADSDSLKKVFTELINQFLPAEDPTNYQAPDTFMNAVAKDLAETLVYGLMAFAYNFDASMEEIYKLNPDIQVMVIDCYNMMAGTTFKGLEIFGGADVLAIYDTFVDIANLYTRSLSPWASRLVHVDLGKVGSEDYPVLFLEYFIDFDEYIEVDGKKLVGWNAFTQRQYELLLEKDYDVDEAWDIAEFYTNEAKEAVERFVMSIVPPSMVGVSGIDSFRDEYGKWAPFKSIIDSIDGIVNNLQSTIQTNLLVPIADVLDGVIADYGYDSFETLVEEAISGVELVETAVSGVQLANDQLIPIIVDTLVPALKQYGMFGRDMIISVIKSKLAEYTDMIPEGFGTEDEIANMLYDAAELYRSINDSSAAEKATVIFVVSYALEKMDPNSYSGDSAEQMAAIAYEMESSYAANGGSYEAAMEKFFDLTKGEADYSKMVSIVYNLNDKYCNALDNLNKTEAEAVEYAIICLLADYLVFELGINVLDYAEGFYVAGNLYDIYKSVKASTDSVLVMPSDGSIANLLPHLHDINADAPVISGDFATLIEKCYLNYYDGQYYNHIVREVVCNFMTIVAGVDLNTAENGYDNLYCLQSNIPYLFADVAEINTIYFDALLGAIIDGAFNPESVIVPYIMQGKDLATSETYELDCSFLTMYIRMLSLDGLFMHPGTEGQSTFGRLVADALDEFVPNKVEEESTFYMSGDESKQYRILSLGKGLSLVNDVNDDSYINYVVNTLDSVRNNVNPETDLVGDFIGEIDSFGDNEYDIIFLNVGAGNISYPISVVSSAMAGSPIAVPNLADLDILKASQAYDEETGKNDPNTSIGARFDSMLGGDGMLGAVKAFMYGYADFASSLEPLVQEAVEHSPNAKIFLVGLPALVADGSVISYNGAAFNLDLLVDKIVSDFNGHMEVIAEKYENVFYIKTSDIDNGLNTNIVLSYSDNGASADSDIATAMSEVLFEEEDHREIAKRILCDTLGIHAPSDEPTEDSIPATCEGEGTEVYSGCTLCDIGEYTRTVEALGHDHSVLVGADEETLEAEFEWYNEYKSAKAIFECSRCESTVISEEFVDNSIDSVDTATCTEDGTITYTAVIEINGKKYKDEIIIGSPAKGHAYGEPTWEWTKNEDGVYVNAEATFVCANDEEHVEKVSTEEFSVKVVTEPTCTGVGENEYTATVEFNDKEYSNTNPEYVVVDKIAHAYDKPVWAWSEDYSEATASFNCIACDDVQVVEAEIESETTKSTCLEHGETVYTATVVFGDDKKEFTDSKTVELELGDHDYVDDICSVCGEKDPDARPDETGDCVYVTEEELDADGVYTMTLGGEEVGEFEFVAVDGGWTISDDGEYLAIENGKLVYSENAFVWTFEDDMFSASETVVEEIKKGFWGGLFGGSDSTEIVETTTTYYLAVVEDELTAGEIGDVAEFSVKHHDDKHSYDEGVVTKPTCTEKGYTTYTCEKCGEECVYNEREKIEHNYVDGECEDCGKLEDVEEPEEPEEPEENCIYIEEVELEEDGSYILSIGGYEVGKYTVTAVDDGWTIFDEKDETYLAVLNGILVYTDEEFVWAYDEEECKFFYEDVKVVTATNNFWGGLFGGSTSTETIVTVYYIVPEEDKLVVSEDDELAEVTFEVIVVEEGHDYVDGICENCGKCEDDTCVHFDAVELEENGEYVLIIGDEHLGFHTFENVDEDLWTIVNEDGDYVALEDGEIVYTSEEFVWTYDSEKSVFSVEIVTVATSSFWGGLFGGNTSTKVETYYLVAEDGNLAVSLKDKTATAEFLVEVEGEHEYGDLEDYYGLGRSFCENCGTVKFEIAE